jgi:hypothetical protein
MCIVTTLLQLQATGIAVMCIETKLLQLQGTGITFVCNCKCVVTITSYRYPRYVCVIVTTLLQLKDA